MAPWVSPMLALVGSAVQCMLTLWVSVSSLGQLVVGCCLPYCMQDLALLKHPSGTQKPSTLSEAITLSGVAPQTSVHPAGNDALAIATILRDLATHGVLPHEVSGAPAAAAAAPVVSTNVVKLRGLPWQASTKDIETFFAPKHLVPKRVVMSLTPAGRPSGHAFVEFENVAEATVALELNRQILGGRYIEVFPSTPVCAARACPACVCVCVLFFPLQGLCSSLGPGC